MKNILIFKRPFKHFSKYVKVFEEIEGYKFSYISDFKNFGDFPLMENVYRLLKKGVEHELTEKEFQQIILRDRYLKYISEKEAKDLIQAVWNSIDEIFSNNDIDGVLSMPIDNYILNIIQEQAKCKKIPILIPYISPLNGYFVPRYYGNSYKIREVADSEVNETYENLKDKYFKPKWLKPVKSTRQLAMIYFKERVKKIVFSARKTFNNDKYSFHYNCVYPMPGAITIHSWKDVFSQNNISMLWEDVKRSISDNNFEKVIYFPLQFVPESSLNYGIDDCHFHDYLGAIKTVIENTPKGYALLFKEHPDFFGHRRESFYKEITSYENTYLVDINTKTDSLIEYANFLIVTGSASTGIEAIIKNKTVISLGGTYYDPQSLVSHNIKDFSKVSTISEKYTEKEITDDKQKRFLKYLLESSEKGIYDFEFRHQKNNNEHRKTVIKFLDILKKVGEGKVVPRA